MPLSRHYVVTAAPGCTRAINVRRKSRSRQRTLLSCFWMHVTLCLHFFKHSILRQICRMTFNPLICSDACVYDFIDEQCISLMQLLKHLLSIGLYPAKKSCWLQINLIYWCVHLRGQIYYVAIVTFLKPVIEMSVTEVMIETQILHPKTA